MIKAAVFGTGFVGLVTGARLAEIDHDVVGVGIAAAKLEDLNQGHPPIYEPVLGTMVSANRGAGRLSFPTEAAAAVTCAQMTKAALSGDMVSDGRNIYDPAVLEAAGLTHCGIDRGRSFTKVGLRAS